MTDPKWDLTGVHGANKYLWAKLQSELGWTPMSNGAIPIVPTQQEPELNQGTAPFIVYNYSVDGIGENSWEIEESIAYSIYHQDEKIIRQTIKLIATLFKDYNDSAGALNDFIKVHGTAANKAFDYKYTSVTGMSGAQPSDDVGDRKDGLVIIRLCYTEPANDPLNQY